MIITLNEVDLGVRCSCGATPTVRIIAAEPTLDGDYLNHYCESHAPLCECGATAVEERRLPGETPIRHYCGPCS